MHELQLKQADRQAREDAAAKDQQTLEVLKRCIDYLARAGLSFCTMVSHSHCDCKVGRAVQMALLLLTAVNHQKARAIFLDPGEGDARALEDLRAAFLRDPVPGVTLPSC